MSEKTIAVEVACATPARQIILSLQVPVGTTALEAVHRSGIHLEFPELDIDTRPLGIFSQPLDGRTLPLPDEYVLQARDRVEIYRPLLIDPKQARLARAKKSKAT
ncbi:MAG: hypothetical protein RLZZ385_1824 [Pseudomonadota bacterium]|jgi:putative ubiquitin-RnfH superfamily antitoxin RatB of RatAB toxin-antitoxin module